MLTRLAVKLATQPLVNIMRTLAMSTLGESTASPTARIVAGTRTDDAPAPEVAAFSSRGPALAGGGDLLKPDILAPGVDVYSTRSGSGYGFSTGCSYSAPLAAGVAALVLARHPDWTRDQVRLRLRESCDKVGGVPYDAQGRHDEYGFGRINAEKAVQ